MELVIRTMFPKSERRTRISPGAFVEARPNWSLKSSLVPRFKTIWAVGLVNPYSSADTVSVSLTKAFTRESAASVRSRRI